MVNIQCRPMEISDFGIVECRHWASSDHVQTYTKGQGIASMLAFDGERYAGQLYLQEYDPQFRTLGGWTGERPWADFQVAEPLGIGDRLLTLGCYHIGEQPNGFQDPSFKGRGISKALLKSVVDWLCKQEPIDGLLSWGVVPGSWDLLQWGGQLPYTVYERFGFREAKRIRDPRLDHDLADIDTTGADEDPSILRVMLLTKDWACT